MRPAGKSTGAVLVKLPPPSGRPAAPVRPPPAARRGRAGGRGRAAAAAGGSERAAANGRAGRAAVAGGRRPSFHPTPSFPPAHSPTLHPGLYRHHHNLPHQPSPGLHEFLDQKMQNI